MTSKIDLKVQDTEKATMGEEKGKPVIISFSDLYKMKQVGLEQMVRDHGCVFLVGRELRPLKIELAGLH